MMRLSPRFAAAAARNSYLCVVHARAGFRSARGARAGVAFASCCGGESATRPRHCAAFSERCAMMGSSRRFAAAAVRASH
eukprot:11159132-Lingulodinium_polyedra.AAC.1